MNKNKEHYKRIEEIVRQIQLLYYRVADHSVNLSFGIQPKGDIFYFKDYPVLKRQIDALFDEMYTDMDIIIKNGISQEWNKANENNDELLSKLLKKTNIPVEKYQNRNLKALEAFQNRKIKGLTLSDRVWRYTNQYKTEIEQALDVGIADGRSAAELSIDIQKYVRYPDELLRRVRDKNGVSPGQGIYRSSYKNALRLARTEINTSYRTADYERWQQMDFVVGIEVRRSNRVYDCPVCESLKGKYPKDFKFTQWHPNCRCFAISILCTAEELIKARETDNPIQSKNEVKDVPDNFKNWVNQNEQRIDKARGRWTEPWWMRDNKEYVNEAKNIKVVFSTIDEAREWAEKVNIQEKHKSAILNYTGEQYNQINSYLRGQRKDVPDNIKQTINDLSEFIEISPKIETTSFRGISVSKEDFDLFSGMKKGDNFIDKAFMSTSHDYSIAKSFSGGNPYIVEFKINGKSGVLIERFSDNKNEAEIIFNKKSNFTIKSIKKKKSKYIGQINIELDEV